MTDANETYEAITQELNELNISDAELETEEEDELYLFQEDEASDELPQSMLRYFEASKTRAAVCEKLILEDVEDLTAPHHSEDTKDLSSDSDEDLAKLNEQVICEIEIEDSSNTSTDTSLYPAPTETETEALLAHNVSVCCNNEDEVEGDEYLECEKHLAVELRMLESSLKEEEEKKNTEHQTEREKQQHEEREKEERRRLRERDFEEEMRKIEEVEKLHQKDLELIEKTAQEKLEQELLQQKELISSLQRQVEEERRRREEEEEKIKKEQNERKKREEERKRLEAEEMRKRQEEEKRKEERKKLEEERKKMQEEEKRKKREEGERREGEEVENKKRQEERIKMETERKKMEEEARRKKEQEENRKREEIRLKKEEATRKREGEVKRRNEEERKTEEEEERKREDGERRKREEEEKRKREEERKNLEAERKKMEEEERRKKEEEEKKKGEDEKKTKEEEYRKKREEGEMRKREEEEKRKREEERKKMEAEREKMDEEVRRKREEEENVKREEEIRLKEQEERKKRVEEDKEREEGARRANELQKKEREEESLKTDDGGSSDPTPDLLTSQLEDTSSPDPSHTTTSVEHIVEKITHISPSTTVDGEDPSTAFDPLSMCLPEHTEQKRLSWMRDCIPWSKLSLRNRRKQRGSTQSRRGPKRASSLPPLCPDTLLQSGGSMSLQEVTTVTLEDLPGCSLSTLAQCPRLRSLTLRRCGLKALDSVSQCPELCYIDVQENNITFVDCENMASLRVLLLSHNQLTSIHGLSGAVNLDVLELSYNTITRIAGLESMKRLQRLSVDHNQLISTKGLREVFTLLHLDCSHNHLTSVEGLENCALLSTLELRANNLTEPPSLNNQILLRELHLDDNSISSLQGLSAYWLPLMRLLSVAQNSITQLSSMSDCVSLVNLDLRHNCLSELRNVCESLEGCPFLREIHLTGNPLQQESVWRSTLQKAVPGLRAIDGQETNSSPLPPAVHEGSLPPGSFLAFCQAQLQQTHALQQQHSRELSGALSPLDAVKVSCRHFTEALQLAEDQRFAHECGDTAVSDRHRATSRTTPEETLNTDSADATKLADHPEIESPGNAELLMVPPLSPTENSGREWTFEETSATQMLLDVAKTVGPEMGQTVSNATYGSSSSHSLSTKEIKTPSNPRMAPMSNPQKLDLKNTAAVVIQQHWRKHRHKCGNIISPPTAEKGGGGEGDGVKVASGPSHIEGSVLGLDYAATVIQAFWRGFALRKRLTSALASAAAACPDAGEDDSFEEVDVDEFVFDEAALEKDWTSLFSEDSPPRSHPVSAQPVFPKHPGLFPEPSQYTFPTPLAQRPKQAWVVGEQVESAGQRVSPESTNRTKSPASTSVLSGLSERSEKILEEWGFSDNHTALLMLKRAQKMKSKKQRQKKLLDPSVRLALFRNCTNQLHPLEAGTRPAADKGHCFKVREAEQGLQRAGKAEHMRLKEERTFQWLHTQTAQSDRHSESERFLPEIDPGVLSGGRVQLVSGPGYREHPDHASGLRANSSSVSQTFKEHSNPRRNSWGHARKEVPSPERVTSAPSKKERISFRDNPVQLSGGWGGGKKRECK